MTTLVLFGVSLLIVVVASELFTNAVEWAGWRLGLGSGATGSLLAALGTALPETIVPVVALVGRRPDANDVAIGGVVGAPFLLLTLGMGVTGLAVWLRRADPVLQVDRPQVRRDLGTFAAGAGVLGIGLLLPLPGRIVCAVVLAGIYARHIVATLGGDEASDDMPEPLHLTRFRDGAPPMWAVAVQLLAAVCALIVGADLFVEGLNRAAVSLGISALVLAVVPIPVATELPETLNSVFWVRSRDDRLALGNVTGAAAFQACIPGIIGVVFTPWRLGPAAVISAIVTFVTAAYLMALLVDGRARGTRLMLCAVPWVGYVVLVVLLGSRLGGAPPAG